MDAILSTFVSAFQNGASNLQGRAMGLLFTLMTIDFFLAVVKSLGQGGTNYFSLFLQKLFPYGAIIYMVSNYSSLVNVVIEGFVQVGQIVGGLNFSLSPEEIFNKGINLFITVLENINQDENLTFMKIIKGEAGGALFTAIATFLGYLGILICFTVIALQIAICYIEFHLGAAYLIIFLPFLVFKPMSFLGEKAIGFIIGFGVKYMVLISIVGVALNSIDSLVEQATADPSLAAIFTVLGAALLIAYLAWQAPALAAGIMSGGPSLTAGGMAHSAFAAGSAATGLVTAGLAKAAEKYNSGKEKLGKASDWVASKFGSGNNSSSSNSQEHSSSGANVLNSGNASDSKSSSTADNGSSKNSSSDNSSFNSSGNNSERSGNDTSKDNNSSSNSSSNSSEQKSGNNATKDNNSSSSSQADSSSGSISTGNTSEINSGSKDTGNSASVLSSQNSSSASSGNSNSGSTINSSGSSSSGSNGVRAKGSPTSGIETDTSKSSLNSGNNKRQKGFSSGTRVNGKIAGQNQPSLSEKIQEAGNKMQNILNKANATIPEDEHSQGGIQARIE